MSIEAVVATLYAQPPSGARNASELTSYRVLMMLAEHADERGENAYPSIKTIGEQLAIGYKRDIENALANLVKQGRIIKTGEHQARKRGTTYRVVLDPVPATQPGDSTGDSPVESVSDSAHNSTGAFDRGIRPGDSTGAFDRGIRPGNPRSEPNPDSDPDPNNSASVALTIHVPSEDITFVVEGDECQSKIDTAVQLAADKALEEATKKCSVRNPEGYLQATTKAMKAKAELWTNDDLTSRSAQELAYYLWRKDGDLTAKVGTMERISLLCSHQRSHQRSTEPNSQPEEPSGVYCHACSRATDRCPMRDPWDGCVHKPTEATG